jgi:hypothetical protein
VVTAIDSPGRCHADNRSVELGLGHHVAEQGEESGLSAAGHDHVSRQGHQFKHRRPQRRSDVIRGQLCCR